MREEAGRARRGRSRETVTRRDHVRSGGVAVTHFFLERSWVTILTHFFGRPRAKWQVARRGRSRDLEENTDSWHCVECSSGRFLPRFRLPENAKVDQVKASMENDVLTVTMCEEEAGHADVKGAKPESGSRGR